MRCLGYIQTKHYDIRTEIVMFLKYFFLLMLIYKDCTFGEKITYYNYYSGYKRLRALGDT